MISFYRKKINIAIFGLVALIGCENKEEVVNSYISPTCIKAQKTCSFINEAGEYSLAFDVAHVVSETPFHYYLSYTGDHKLISAQGYVEGKNMYMGKIPVFFESLSASTSEDNIFKGEGLLGSCSEDIMHWDLHVLVKLQDIKTQQEVTQEIIFSYSSQRY